MDQNQKRKPQREIKLGKIYATKKSHHLDPTTKERVPEYVIVTEMKPTFVVFHYVNDIEKYPMGSTVKAFLENYVETWDEAANRENLQREKHCQV